MATLQIQSASQRRVDAAPLIQNNIGEGLATAIGALGDAFNLNAESKLRLQENDAQIRQQSTAASLDAEWIRRTEGFARDQAEAQRTGSLDATGFANGAYASAQGVSQEFLATVPENLRYRYEAKTAQFEEMAATNAYSYETTTRQGVYLADLTELRQLAIDQISSGQGTVEEWSAKLEDFQATSPLPALQTQETINGTQRLLQGAQLARDLEVEALQVAPASGSIGVADGSDVVAAGLPASGRTVLNGIASTESPGYNVMYGGGTFDPSQGHPNQRVPIGDSGEVSTAAGRYQFIHSTWLAAAALAGVDPNNFSPENQDRAAWAWAQKTVQDLTGMDLTAAMASGDREVLRQVKDAIGTQWEGIRLQSLDDFITGASQPGSGTPSALIADPRYSAVPFDERVGMWEGAQASAEQVAARRMQEQATQTQAQVSELLAGINNKTADFMQVQSFLDNTVVTQDQQQAITKAYDTVHATEIASASFATKLNNPASDFANTAENREQLNSYFTENTAGVGGLLAMDSTVVQDNLAPVFAWTGLVPETAVATLTSMISQGSPTQRDFAFDSLSAMLAANPRNFNQAFGAETAADISFYNTMRPYLTEPGQLAEAMTARRSPLLAEERAIISEQVSAIRKDQPEAFSYAGIAQGMDFGGSADGAQQRQITREYNELFTIEMRNYGDAELARTAALERLGQQWGESAAAPGRIMRNPPELSGYQPVNGSFDYLRTSVLTAAGLPADANIVTELDIAGGVDPATGLPSYNVLENRDGVLYPVVGADGKPVAITPQPLASYREAVSVQASVDNMLYRTTQLRQQLENTINTIPANQDIRSDPRGAELERLKALEARLLAAAETARSEVSRQTREVVAPIRTDHEQQLFDAIEANQ